jgi:TPR repeat protein
VPFAQFNLGVRYANGQGVDRDPVLAYQWFSLAASGLLGREADAARRARDSIKITLTPEQLARAEEMVKAWRTQTERPDAATPRR